MHGFPFDVARTSNAWITLADRTRLAARLWHPVTDEPVPAILEYLPYRKGDSMAARDESIGSVVRWPRLCLRARRYPGHGRLRRDHHR